MKRNILFVLPCCPYPLDSGGMQAIFNGIDAIKSDHYTYITYPGNGDSSDEIRLKHLKEKLGPEVLIHPFVPEINKKKANILCRILKKTISILYRLTPPPVVQHNPFSFWIDGLLPEKKPYTKHVLNIIKRHKIDIIQCEMLFTLSLVQSFPLDVKKIFIHHELGFVRHQLELKNLVSNIFDGEAILKCSKILEIGQLNQYNCIVTLSQQDQQKLLEAGVTVPIYNSFATVNTSCIGNRFKKTIPTELTFVGPDFHEPNEIGIRWFLESCWRELRQLDPKYHLTIIGKWKKQTISELTNLYPNISFAGFIKELDEIIAGTIMIVPITVGSGIRMKILEASRLEVPFVSTSIGAEGIPVRNEEHCLIADTPKAFTEAIYSLLDSNRASSLARKANQMVKECYSIEALRKNRLAIYDSLYETK